MSATATAYRSTMPVGSDGFTQLVRSEWTKFRTVRGWAAGLLAAAVTTVGVGFLTLPGGNPCPDGAPAGESSCGRAIPRGPGGEAVTDAFTFVHRPLVGDGSITVHVSSLTGQVPNFATSGAPPVGKPSAGPGGPMHVGLVPWAKAGLVVKDGLSPGSSYAAVMLTGGHGVRVQHDFVHDAASVASLGTGVNGAGTPRWLRLTRTGATLSGFQSLDGTLWSPVGTARLASKSATLEMGLFVASPDFEVTSEGFGGTSSMGGPSRATAVFDKLSVDGKVTGAWRADLVGGAAIDLAGDAREVQQTTGGFTVTGHGDIAPAVGGLGANTVEQSLVGAFAGLVFVIVIGAMFVTSEYRRGLIRVTLAASQRRGRMLAAKAVVLGGVTFAGGLVAAATAYLVVGELLRRRGGVVLPVTRLTEVRVVVGTAGLLAVVSVLALAVGTVLRRSAGAVATVVVLVVLPYILAVAGVLPSEPARWLLKVTPAAAFAIQQGIPQYAQVDSVYVPSTGYFPLDPWLGFTVLCAWTVAALVLATVLLNRRDV